MSTDRTAIPLFFNSRKVREWTTDPAHLHFSDYRDRAVWGPPTKRVHVSASTFNSCASPFLTWSSSRRTSTGMVRIPIMGIGIELSTLAETIWWAVMFH